MAYADNEWEQNRKLVLVTLERFENGLSSLGDKIADLSTDVALLKFKSTLWGGVMGGVTGMLVAAGAVLLRHL